MYRGRSVITLAKRTAPGRSSRTSSCTRAIDTVLIAASRAAKTLPRQISTIAPSSEAELFNSRNALIYPATADLARPGDTGGKPLLAPQPTPRATGTAGRTSLLLRPARRGRTQ